MIQLKVNGMQRTFSGDPNMPLLWYLRDMLLLTGTKFGCGVSLCGACTVHKNGEAIRSCVTPMSGVSGAEITTIEGLNAKRAASGAEGLDRNRRAAVWLLPGWSDHAGCFFPAEEA